MSRSNVTATFSRFYFIATLVFYLLFKKNKNMLIIQNSQKTIFVINLDFQSSDSLFYFYFFNQISINLIPLRVIFLLILKNTNKFYFAPRLFILKLFFSKLIKNTKQIKHNLYPELRGFDPSRVRWQRT